MNTSPMYEQTITDLVSTPATNDSLILIAQQIDNFPYLSMVIKRLNITTASLFLPQTISKVAEIIENDLQLPLEAISFLDTVRMLSFVYYNNDDTILNNIYKIITNNRTVVAGSILGSSNIEDLILDPDKLQDFFFNNKTYIALFIVSLLNTMFYKDTE